MNLHFISTQTSEEESCLRYLDCDDVHPTHSLFFTWPVFRSKGKKGKNRRKKERKTVERQYRNRRVLADGHSCYLVSKNELINRFDETSLEQVDYI